MLLRGGADATLPGVVEFLLFESTNVEASLDADLDLLTFYENSVLTCIYGLIRT